LHIKESGATPAGVLWGDGVEGQELRFQLLLTILQNDIIRSDVTINDLGCGYGALFDYIKDMPFMVKGTYYGYDISPDMVKTANARINEARATFCESSHVTNIADYSFISGAFNMCATQTHENWTSYIHESLISLFQKSTKGIAFNLLDIEQNQPQDWLYYANADRYIEFCQNNLSTNVQLVRDPKLKEFTILVYKTDTPTP